MFKFPEKYKKSYCMTQADSFTIVEEFTKRGVQQDFFMEKAGFDKRIGKEYFCKHIDDALALAERIAAKQNRDISQDLCRRKTDDMGPFLTQFLQRPYLSFYKSTL